MIDIERKLRHARSFDAFLDRRVRLSWVEGGCVVASAHQRTIPYDPNSPFADRLLPGDKEVLIAKLLLPGLRAEGSSESFDDEIQRLKLAEVVAIVRIATAKGELADQGAWINTRVTAEIDRLVRSRLKPIGRSTEFGFSGGSMRIGAVVVTAGQFLQFSEGERYLVFLSTDPGIKGLYPGVAFHLSALGALERLKNSTGKEQSFGTNLVGRNVADVLQALERDQS